jgi:hypothetical protein
VGFGIRVFKTTRELRRPSIYSHVDMDLRYTMFQAMVADVDYGSGGLKTVWERTIENDTVGEVYACVPGSLKQRCVYGSGYQVGSLHVRITRPRNVSMLLFSNGKAKCSGSYRDLNRSEQSEINEFIAETVRPVWRALGIDDTRLDETKIDVRLLNAGFTLHNMNERLYFALCNEIRRHYAMVVLPATMTSGSEGGGGVRPRGRFCAMKIYVDDVRPGPSLHFDHTGKVQAFAFRSVEAIHGHTKRLCEVVDRIRNTCGVV